MLLFRSEEHVDRWCECRAIPHGATLTIEQGWRLGSLWYANRLAPDWRRRTPEEAEAVFKDMGLTGPFWRLTA